jgi:RNA polymerase sigma-70 factor (ECF subfamily)
MASRFTLFRKRTGAEGPTTRDDEASPVYPSTKLADEPPLGVAPPLPPPRFDEVYDAHFAFVWRNVLNRGVPSSAVDDVVQEVFVVVHRKLPGFEGRSSLRTWLAGIVRRVVADHVRKRGNAPVGDEPLENDSPSEARGPAEELDAKAAARVLDQLLAQMPEAQREVFILHEIEQMTGREIAESVGANENTVHTRLRAARRIFEEGLARLRGE